MKRKWIIAIVVAVILAVLSFVGFAFYMASQMVVIKYGTPNYRPKIE